MDNEKVTAQVVVQSYDTMNKNKRVYRLNDVQEAIRKQQLSTIYGIANSMSEDIKIRRLENDNKGFLAGYLYCFSKHLKSAEMCEKCESREQCIKDEDYTNQAIRRFQEKDGD